MPLGLDRTAFPLALLTHRVYKGGLHSSFRPKERKTTSLGLTKETVPGNKDKQTEGSVGNMGNQTEGSRGTEDKQAEESASRKRRREVEESVSDVGRHKRKKKRELVCLEKYLRPFLPSVMPRERFGSFDNRSSDWC